MHYKSAWLFRQWQEQFLWFIGIGYAKSSGAANGYCLIS